MYKLAMCKKSQEVDSKNNDVNKELSKTKTTSLYADIKNKITIKYVTTALPVNSNPSYDALAIYIN